MFPWNYLLCLMWEWRDLFCGMSLMSSPSDRSQVKVKIWINERRNSNHDSVILLGAFCRNTLGPSVTSKRGVTANQHTVVGSDRLQPMIPHFFPGERFFFEDDNAQSLGRDTGCFDEYENDVNYMLWPSQLPDVNPTECWPNVLGSAVYHHHHHHHQNTKWGNLF